MQSNALMGGGYFNENIILNKSQMFRENPSQWQSIFDDESDTY